jgi:peptidoglycan L-alanyl-D-glutamate endopeptidase CwlK
MPEFSQKSLNILNQSYEDLIKLFKEVIKEYDCTIICAYRGQADQEAAYNAGMSHAHFKQSPHNFIPALAVDVVPYPTLWSDKNKLRELSEVVKKKANELDINIVWGGDFEGFEDMPHYQLRDWMSMI